MSRFDSPLDDIRVASPCPANWDEMFGDERIRFCGECKLNVYNLSGMTRREAEDLITNWEGQLCVRFFRRADGTVLTKDCPVGWAAVKRRLSRAATAVFSLFAGVLAGLGASNLLERRSTVTEVGVVPIENSLSPVPLMGDIAPESEPVMGKPMADGSRHAETKSDIVGERMAPITPAVKKTDAAVGD